MRAFVNATRDLLPLSAFGVTLALGFAALLLFSCGPVAPAVPGSNQTATAALSSTTLALATASDAAPDPSLTPPPETLEPPPPTPTTSPLPATLAAAPPSSTPTPALLGSPTPSPTLAPPGELDEQLFALINSFRVANGCPALISDPLLRAAAQRHAEDLAAHDLISHEGSDGATYSERLDRVGFPYQLRGENIAAGYRMPAEIMTLWTEGDENPSGPHRLNILNCDHTEAGVGLAYDKDDYPYWVLDMASRRA